MTALEEKVLAAHPLTASARMVVMWAAHHTPPGEAVVTVNRTGVARALEMTAAQVRRGFTEGEQAGLLTVHANGAVSWRTDDLPLVDKPAPSGSAVTTSHVPPVPMDRPQVEWAIGMFTQVWSDRYGEGYRFIRGKDHALAKSLAIAFGNLTSVTERAKLERAMRAYLASEDRFYLDKGHPFPLFCATVNQFLVAATTLDTDDEYDRAERRRQAARSSR